MRLLLLIFLVMSATCVRAARPSRILFFSTLSGEFADGSSKQSAAVILKNGSAIGRLSPLSIFIFNSIETVGKYQVGASEASNGLSADLTFQELDGGIIFVLISPEVASPGSARMNVLSYEEFKAYYSELKWLRKALRNEGYGSTAAIANGFELMPMDLVLPQPKGFKLGDTVHYDQTWHRAERKTASYYRVASADTGGLFLITDYELSANRLRARGHFRTLDSVSFDGPYEEYYSNGAIKRRGNYADGKLTGRWEYFRERNGNRLWYSEELWHGKHDGMLMNYYPDGSLKRKELWKIMRDTVREYDADPLPAILERDSLISGKQYTLDSIEITYTPFLVRPTPAFDLTAFLNSRLVYPRQARTESIEGQAVVEFTVTKTGLITNAMIVRHAHPLLDAEALRVVNAMPRWTPGLMDDEPVDVSFSLPVTFRLD